MRRWSIRQKACPRCRGDILLDEAYEDSELCLQCGFRGDVIPAHLAHLLDEKETKRKYALKEEDKLLLKSK